MLHQQGHPCLMYTFLFGICFSVSNWSEAQADRYTCCAPFNRSFFFRNILYLGPGRVAQSVTCLATDVCLTADPGVASSIPVRSHTFVEIDHEMISTVILLPSADSFKKGCCQLQAKVCARITG